jgi:hypothetical protein
LTEEQIAAVEAVAMDMWDPYVNSTLNHLPDASRKIVYDKFHIAKHLSEAVDQVRRREHRQLKASGNDRLAGTRYDWLRHPGKWTRRDSKEFAALRDSNLKTAKAWALKEGPMALFEYTYERPARRHYQGWRNWATRCRLKPIVEKSRMIHRRSKTLSLTSSTALRMLPVNRLIQRSNGSSTLPAASAIGRTSKPRSTSTAAASTSCRPPTKFPECPQCRRACIVSGGHQRAEKYWRSESIAKSGRVHT